MKTLKHLKSCAIGLLAFCAAQTTLAQNADPLVFSVGKTFETNDAATLHNYILWQPGDASTILGKRFAVYAKEGDANSNDNYSLLSIQQLQSSPSAIQALLKLGELFDADKDGLAERIVALNAEAQGLPLPQGYTFPSEINLEVAQNLAQIISVALDDAEVLQSLISLGRAHPGVQMCLGLGFAIETPTSSLITYEIREIDNSDNDLRVIGRVTLDADNPQLLFPPDPPRQVFHINDPNLQLNASAKDHLNVLTRWGTPNDLREVLPHTYGFNLYRIAKLNLDDAVVDPNDIFSEETLLGLGGTRVNQLPAVATSLITDAEAADTSFQEGDFFYGDDNDAPDPGFEDGEQFYYYVAARDIAGHPGPLSLPSLLITVCDRLPPPAPAIVSVDNIFDMAGSDPLKGTGTQHLQVVIEQLPDTPEDRTASEYRIYRWHAATDWMRLGADPEFNYIGSVAHKPGKRYAYFDDDDPTDLDLDMEGGQDPNDPMVGADTGAPVVTSENDSAMGQTFWYTVRAVDTSACDPQNYSGHSGPAYGVPRDRVGPEKPKGSLVACYCLPGVVLTNEGTVARRSDYDLSPTAPGFVVRVDRTDQKDQSVIKKIKSFDVQYGSFVVEGKVTIFDSQFGTTHYYKGFERFGDIIVPIEPVDGKILRVRARLGDGSVSDWRTLGVQPQNKAPEEITRYDFRAFVEICCPTLISSSFLRDDNGRIDERIAAFLPGEESSSQDCPPWIEVIPGNIPPPHSSVGPDDSITGICGDVYLSSGVREVRVYRRVDNAPNFQLISRQSSESDFGPLYTWKEIAPPLNNGTNACYYAQVFDQHGNASAMVRLGCVTVQNDDLGVPMLMDPVNLDPEGNLPVVQLSWFCDPVGIDRFEVLIATEGGEPSTESPSTQLLGPIEMESQPTITTDADQSLTFEVYRTLSIASGFGKDGEFSINLVVPADKKQHYVVRGIGAQVPNPDSGAYQYTVGDFSNIVSDVWMQPPTGPQSVIPWPARPLPGINETGIDIEDFVPGEGPLFAYAIPQSDMNVAGASAAILVGLFPATGTGNELNYEASFPTDREPIDWAFDFRTQIVDPLPADKLESIVPFVIYRYQVPSPLFQDAKPNLVQVTPLIDRISYETQTTTDKNGTTFSIYRARDPFFIFSVFDQSYPTPMPVPLSGKFSRDPADFIANIASSGANNNPEYLSINASDVSGQRFDSTMWVRDVIPATSGATYQYLLVHFTERGEINRIIPTNTISHP